MLKNRYVVLLTTLHQGTEIVDYTKKPEIIQFYKETKSGVDTLDQAIRNYTSKRRTNRWPQCLLYNILNTSEYIDYVIYISITTPNGKRNLFDVVFI